MANPIMELLGRANPVLQTIFQMFGMVKASKNPQAVLQQLTKSDPRMQEVMNVIQQNGGNAKAVFYSLAKQKGVDPNDILQQVQGMMK